MNRTIEIIKAAIEYIGDGAECLGLQDIVPFDQVCGDRQSCDHHLFDHEYVDQYGSDDSYSGQVYLPLESGEYLQMGFCT